MDYQAITESYYSHWLGNPAILQEAEEGITFVYSPERNKIQPGYSKPFDLYVFAQKNRAVVSYGDKASDRIERLRIQLRDVKELSALICQVYQTRAGHSLKFCCCGCGHDARARALTGADYPQYFSFFKKANPDCRDTDWLREYFDEMTAEKLCCGVFDDGLLVSCTDAPSMPYIAEKVQEIGIHTLPEYRGRGYAAAACRKCAENIVLNGKCPQWSCAASNAASVRLAQKIGFNLYADVFTCTL